MTQNRNWARLALAYAAALALAFVQPSLAWGKPPGGGGGGGGGGLTPQATGFSAVTTGDWANLTSGAHYKPNVAAFDDTAPDVVVSSGGVALLQDSDVTAGLRAKNRASDVSNLMVLITLGPGALLSGVQLSLVGVTGPQSSVLLSASNAIGWSAAGLPPGGVGGLESGDPFKRETGTVIAAILNFAVPLSTVDPASDSLLATIRYQFLGMTAGAARIDYFGVDASGNLAYNSSNSGGGVFVVAPGGGGGTPGGHGGGEEVPEPTGIAIALLSIGAFGAARRSTRR